MRRKPYPIFDITKGLDVSVIPLFLTDGASPNLNCIRFHKGIIKKDLGFVPFVDDAAERPMKLYMFTKWAGTLYYALATVDDFYYLNADTWTQVRPVAT